MYKNSHKKKSHKKLKIDFSDPSQFCPVCQVPFHALKIKSSVHTSNCEVNIFQLEGCQEGLNCTSTDIFHYRDYSHQLLLYHRTQIRECINSSVNLVLDLNRVDGGHPLEDQKSGEEAIDDESESELSIFKPKCGKHTKHVRKKVSKCNIDSINLDHENTLEPVANKDEIFEKTSDVNTDYLQLNDNEIKSEDSFNRKHNSSDSITDLSASHTLQKKEKCKTEWKLLLDGTQEPNITNNNIATNSNVPKGKYSLDNTLLPKNNKKIKICPSHKKIPGTRFAVDAFEYGAISGISTYFLTHFHFDHYIGLKKSFSLPLYCTTITANLVKKKIKVNEKFIHILECKKSIMIEKVEVIPLDSNHCPGSVILLFRLPNGEQYLHTGDFRANADMEKEPILMESTITKLFLDTTYCDPNYIFPSQREVISRVKSIVQEKHELYPHALFICGSYTIGKEKVFLGILEELNCKLWAERSKYDVFKCLDNDLILSAYTENPKKAKLHILSMRRLKFDILNKYLSDLNGIFTHIFAFKPTGWEFDRSDDDWVNISSYENISIYGVPYSEHSSYDEICQFVRFIKPSKIVPTVNLGNRNMHAMLKDIVASYTTGAKQSRIDKFVSKLNI